jgi:predicted kinase
MIDDNPYEFFSTKLPIFVMCCGIPYSGKSTWAKAQSFPVVDTDSFIEERAKVAGVEYHEIFQQFYKDSETRMFVQVASLLSQRKSFTWDQTNLTVKSRLKKLDLVNEQKYFKVALWFETDKTEQRRRSRTKLVGQDAMNSMSNYATRPTLDEGFDLVILKKN